MSEVEGGFPHSEILGSKLVRSSPRLIAAYHVLHRLSAPRHPPNALKALDRSHDRCPPLGRVHDLTEVAAGHRQKDQLLRTRQAPVRSGTECWFSRPPAGDRPGMFPLHNVKSRAHPPRAGRKLEAPDIQDPKGAAPIHQTMVEPDGIEPTTSCLQSTRSPN